MAARGELIRAAGQRLQLLTRKIYADYQRLKRYEDSGDVLQTALIRLMRRLEASPPDDVPAFFQLAAREIRCSLLDMARHYYGPRGAGTKERSPIDEVDVAADSNSGRLIDWTEFHELVETMPAEERVVVDLLWYHGMTREEAADVLDLSLATIKRRWMTARIRLQKLVLPTG